jgi:hypothetical protein
MGEDVNYGRPADGITPLFNASQEGHVHVVEWLIGAGADVNQARTDSRTTPLHIAAECGRVLVVEVLIAAGADVNTGTTVDGATPLYVACQNGFLDIVERLIGARQGLKLVPYSAQLELFCPLYHPTELMNVSWSCSSLALTRTSVSPWFTGGRERGMHARAAHRRHPAVHRSLQWFHACGGSPNRRGG